MTITSKVTDWTARTAALRDTLVAEGKLTSSEWEAAVLAVPRHVFVPSFYAQRDGAMVKIDAANEADRPGWLETVYSNTALVTKLSGGTDAEPTVFLSSSSTPGLMTRMLEALDVRDGQRVLEIGTGTGYNAALLCHRLGAANVFSIDVEPELIDLARVRLAELGYRPTLVAGDGATGLPEHAPFDRIIGTCSVPAIPWPWVEETLIGGVILTDIRAGLNAGNLVRLTRTGADRAVGWFDAGQASFMELRHAPGVASRTPYVRSSEDGPVTRDTTALDPRMPWTNPVVWFLAALRIGPRYRLGYTGGDPRRGPRAVSLSIPDGSRCEITLTPSGDGTRLVRESGPTRLWTHIEDAHLVWDAAGRPDWRRLGLTVTATTQTVFVDAPDTVIARLRPGRADVGSRPMAALGRPWVR